MRSVRLSSRITGRLHCYRAEPGGNAVDREPVTATLIRRSKAEPDQHLSIRQTCLIFIYKVDKQASMLIFDILQNYSILNYGKVKNYRQKKQDS